MNLSDYCQYSKALIVPRIDDDFQIADRFRHGLSDEEIRSGIDAFREFLYTFYDKLSAEKDSIDIIASKKYNPYDKRDKYNARVCFPTLHDLTMCLFTLGIRGNLDSAGIKLVVRADELLTVICERTEKYMSFVKMSGARRAELFHFLYDLGVRLDGLELTRDIDFAGVDAFAVTSVHSDYFPIGLKLLAEATANHRDYYYIMNVFGVLGRCDYRPLANPTPKPHIMDIIETANSQSEEVREWIAQTHNYLVAQGCICSGRGEFTYTPRGSKKRKAMALRLWLDITGCYACPAMGHFNSPGSIVDELPDSVFELVTAKAERECGWCAHSRREPGLIQCRPGCPIEFTRGGVSYRKCRYAEFRIDMSDAANREIVSRWIERELRA